jgi:riboflavin kinase/FMN adenylyltransferase
VAFRLAHSAVEWGSVIGGGSRTVISVGNFDGLHVGHQRILKAVVERARRENEIAAVVTFDPHPLKVLRPSAAPPLIMTIAQRLAGFAEFGLDAALVIRFDEALAHVPAEEFVRTMLVKTVHAGTILVGANFRFGYQQAGDVELLMRLGKDFGFAVEIVPPAEVKGKLVSSTAIRQAVSEGRVEEAAELLGHPFALIGTIQPGAGRGSKIVFPTLNLAAEQELLPAKGVYATETTVREKSHRSVTNVGVRPTFDGQGITVESHLFDFSETVTSGRMEVRFYKRIREERKFPDANALRAQIGKDIETARSFFLHP